MFRTCEIKLNDTVQSEILASESLPLKKLLTSSRNRQFLLIKFLQFLLNKFLHLIIETRFHGSSFCNFHHSSV